jgi:hypothetical protein
MKRVIHICIVVAWTLLSSTLHAATRILVFPFEAANNVPRWEWLSHGLAAEIELRLLRISSVDVALYPEYVSAAKANRIARSHRVDAFVHGEYRVEGGFVEVTSEVVNFSNPDMPRSFDGRAPFENLLTSIDNLCSSLPVATGARLLRAERGLLDHPSTINTKGFESYAEGLAHLRAYSSDPFSSEDHLVPALVAMMRARALDDAFFGPSLQIGKIHEASSNPDKAIASFQEALGRAPGLRPARDAIDRLTRKSL